MPVFRYEARTPAGGSEAGEIPAKNRGHALVLLRARGLLVDALAEAKGGPGRQGEAAGRHSLLYPLCPVRASSLAFFFDQLGRLLSAGVTPHDAFGAMQQRVGGRLRRVCREGAAASAGGSTISSHLARYPSYFGPHVIATMHAAELSGALPEACQELQHQFDTDQRVAWQMFILKLYLALNLIPCIFVPSFPGMIRHTNEKGANAWEVLRPGLQWYGHHVLHHIAPWLVGGIALWLLAKIVLHLPGMRGVRDWLSLSVPVIGWASKKTVQARFARTLELLTKAAVPPDQAVREAALATGNVLVARRLAAPAAALKQGGSMAETIRSGGIYGPSEISLLTTAEQTGTVEDALGQLAEKTRREREDVVRNAGRGGCVAGILLSAVCVLYAAAVGWTTLYEAIYSVFEQPQWQP